MQLGLRVGRRFPPRSHARQGQREQVEPPGLSVQGRYREHDATQPVTRGGPRGRACAGKCPWPASLAGVSLLSAEVVTTSGAVCLGVSRWGRCWRAVLPGLCSGSRCVGPDARWALRDCTSGLAQLKILRVTSDALKTLITQLSFGISGGWFWDPPLWIRKSVVLGPLHKMGQIGACGQPPTSPDSRPRIEGSAGTCRKTRG